MIEFYYQKKVKRYWILKNKNDICYIILICSILLILLLNIQFKHLVFLEKLIIYIYLTLQILTLISCFLIWKPIIIIISHYILSISIILVIIFSNNLYFLIYILLILILILILWFKKKNRCIFDNLTWDFKIGNQIIKSNPYIMNYGMLPTILYLIYKIIILNNINEKIIK